MATQAGMYDTITNEVEVDVQGTNTSCMVIGRARESPDYDPTSVVSCRGCGGIFECRMGTGGGKYVE
jgi:hypothetical protein